MIYHCCDKNRRDAVKEHPFLNGIDFLDVVDDPADSFEERQTTLMVHFIKPLSPDELRKENVRIEGGERIRNIQVIEVSIESMASPPMSPPFNDKNLVVKVSTAGDFSPYTLRLVKGEKDNDQPDGFDPILSSIEFSFKVLCKKDFDCLPQCECGPEATVQPEINYLAKDFACFRQLMLDRMSVLMPTWRERNPADMGMALVETLAYVADYLSYQQDAIATEAYLGTARKRVSVRRHARLVDYYMHEGCNARMWVHIDVQKGINGFTLLKKDNGKIVTRFLTRTNTSLPKAFDVDSNEWTIALEEGTKVFEPMHDLDLFHAHNRMNFYTWGEKECCLPKGSTSATLLGDLTTLKRGHVLILQEVKGPQTGNSADADPAHRHAVRITDVRLIFDPLFAGSPPWPGLPVTKITWDPADALPFPLCISSKEETSFYDNVSVALGNNVLADHGFTQYDTSVSSLHPDTVGSSVISTVEDSSGCFCSEETPVPVPPKFNPELLARPLTFRATYDVNNPPSATAAMKWLMQDVVPAIALLEDGTTETWTPKNDLLDSGGEDKNFVVEIESDGISKLRFGDGIQGMRPAAETRFLATYRIGNGTVGNVGRESITSIVPGGVGDKSIFLNVTNPLSATGGIDPEGIEEVRQKAPAAFRIQKRAVTATDYEEMSKVCSDTIQRSACTFRWTGSWRTAFLTVDRFGGQEVSPAFENKIRRGMDQFRMAGQDLEVDAPKYVSIELEISICVKPNYFASDVKGALLKVFSNRVQSNGQLGVFHPDNFSFGQSVFLSPLYAAAQSVTGVASVEITKLKRQNEVNNDAIQTGKLPLSRLEIARLDNDPNFPEHGILNFKMNGGK